MCGRYTLANAEGIQDRYDAYNNPMQSYEPSYNIPPGTINPVVARRSPTGIYLMKWGLVPFWAKEPKIGYKMINARSEDIALKPSFRKPIKTQRCLVPATGFFEWKKVNLEGKEEKYPWYITVKDQQLFSFAGIYDVWLDAERKELPTYSIITTTPNKTMATIHNRMPVILDQKDEEKYLNVATPLPDILELLRPFPDEKMKAYPVSVRVNSPRNDDPSLIDQVMQE